MIEEPKCFKRKCVHFLGVKSDPGEESTEVNERPVCKAYPNRIPPEIAYGKILHLEPYPGDHGIQFEKEK